MKAMRIFALLCVLIMATSCGEYQRVLKSTDIKQKYDYAEKLYNEQDYKRASRIFEQIVPQYLGKPQGERVLFMFANALYKQKEYTLAAYQFGRFVSRYPQSQKTEEALFLRGRALFGLIPIYSVDQTQTEEALEVLQSFVDRYPYSQYSSEVNQMVLDIVNQLQKKQFEIAKQYYTIQDYQAALKAMDNFLSETPGTIYKEDALWVKLQASYKLAENSVEAKKQSRFQAAKEAYDSLLKYFPETKYKKKADVILSDIEKQLN